MTNLRQDFELDFGGFQISCSKWLASEQEAAPQALILHGAGKADKNRVGALCQAFAESGITSIAFDFIGHGTSSGLLSESSLAIRTDLCSYIAKNEFGNSIRFLVGFSMGCYNAVHLAAREHVKIEKLILFAPAAYNPEADYASFGSAFSEIIRRPDSWRHSEVFNLIKKYSGQLVIITGDRDDVVPDEIAWLLCRNATSAKVRELVCIGSAGHKLSGWLSKQPESVSTICKFLFASELLSQLDYSDSL